MRLLLLAALAALAAGPAAAKPVLILERVVLVQRHGVRPPTSSNASIARYAAQPWPAWPVAPGELTAHGGETVRLMGSSLRAVYRAGGLLPAHGCPASGELTVWADGSDQRTRRSGEILAEALAPGCGIKAAWAEPLPRDPIFNGAVGASACRIDPDAALTSLTATLGPAVDTPATRSALTRLKSILTPSGCAGEPEACLAGDDKIAPSKYGPRIAGPLSVGASLSEDLLLEYAEGMPVGDVGWGRAGSVAAISAVMPLHQRYFELYHNDRYVADRVGAPMAKLILAALAGEPRAAGPAFGPKTRILALAGHDSNLALMGGVFGLNWTLPEEPDSTAPASALVFELWSNPASHARFVRPVIYYETLRQLRTLAPARARSRPLTFAGCDSGPEGSCPLQEVRRRALTAIPPGCGDL